MSDFRKLWGKSHLFSASQLNCLRPIQQLEEQESRGLLGGFVLCAFNYMQCSRAKLFQIYIKKCIGWGNRNLVSILKSQVWIYSPFAIKTTLQHLLHAMQHIQPLDSYNYVTQPHSFLSWQHIWTATATAKCELRVQAAGAAVPAHVPVGGLWMRYHSWV